MQNTGEPHKLGRYSKMAYRYKETPMTERTSPTVGGETALLGMDPTKKYSKVMVSLDGYPEKTITFHRVSNFNRSVGLLEFDSMRWNRRKCELVPVHIRCIGKCRLCRRDRQFQPSNQRDLSRDLQQICQILRI